jgi:hypothetical protein
MEIKKKRAHRRCKTEGNRICNMCEQEMAATPEFFVTDSSRKYGVGYECLACHSKRKKGRDRSKELVENLTPEQHAKLKARALRYSRSAKGKIVSDSQYERDRSKFLVRSYVRRDKLKGFENNIDVIWFDQNIDGKPCYYCGSEDDFVGCDRIDNDRGHTVDNVVPACRSCNVTRGNRFTCEEMKILGEAIRLVKDSRIMGKP